MFHQPFDDHGDGLFHLGRGDDADAGLRFRGWFRARERGHAGDFGESGAHGAFEQKRRHDVVFLSIDIIKQRERERERRKRN